jgi:EAL domain-containing protein (putative c-di-GMP-specific phosphodiesterase class I)
MYESKAAGRNTFTFYQHDMSYRLGRRSAIMDILRTAIDDRSVYLMFQPQVRPSTGRVVSCEALMRLRSSNGLGFVSPAEFIPVAEETRMIVPLGFWVIRKSIECWTELQRRGIELEGISVNVSEIQLRAPGFLDGVKNILEEYDFDPYLLHLEVTESVMLDNVSDKVAMFEALRKIGVKIELDDFGTGYTSLNYVRMIPLDVIKIDKCFIDDIGKSEEKEALIGLIIGLAATFGASVVAEGVETAAQAEFLKSKGDVIIQGYFYSKPLEIDPLEERIRAINEQRASLV